MNSSDTLTKCMGALQCGLTAREAITLKQFKAFIPENSKWYNHMAGIIREAIACGSWNLRRSHIVSTMDRLITEFALEHIELHIDAIVRIAPSLMNAITHSDKERVQRIRCVIARILNSLENLTYLAQSRIM
jgi:hypothetical protein